tara:strand:+ start:521 stop:763 length:243 start_codon:yes stop_codon:yes gene_type:complete
MHKLTVEKIKQIIIEERKKLEDEGLISSETTSDAWAGGKNLVRAVDYVKKLGIKEQKLRKQADQYAKVRKALKTKLLEEL